MTDIEKQWVEETTTQYYMDLLAKRYPESQEEGTALSLLTQSYGPEAVIRIADTLDGFVTPQPTAKTLGGYALYRFYSQLVESSAVHPVSPQASF